MVLKKEGVSGLHLVISGQKPKEAGGGKASTEGTIGAVYKG